MSVSRVPIADFCTITGEIWTGLKHYWICKKHDECQIVPYYVCAEADPVWSCPKCIEEHLDRDMGLATGIDKCYLCSSETNIAACELCGKPTCLAHRIEGSCDECWEGLECLRNHGYSGLEGSGA